MDLVEVGAAIEIHKLQRQLLEFFLSVGIFSLFLYQIDIA